MPRSIGRDDAGACTMTSHLVQAIFTRTWRITLYVAGTRSRISETSSPSLCNVPPHAGQASSVGKYVCTSRGRFSGSGRRVDLALGVVGDTGRAAMHSDSCDSSSSSFSSSCSILCVTFSLFLPKIILCSLAMTSLRCSISLSRLMRACCSVASYSCCCAMMVSSASRLRDFKSATVMSASAIAKSMP